MLTRRVLLDTPGLRVAEVHCPGHRARWSAPEPITAFGIVLPRRGVFRRRVAGAEAFVDPATGYVQVPGTEQEVAHPARGDLCTTITLPAQADQEWARAGPVHVVPRLGLAHRLLVTRACAGADEVELTDMAIELAAAVLNAAPVQRGSVRPHQRLVNGAREILAAEPDCPLPELANRLAVSPYYLSRVFHRTVGTTLRRFRIRLRTVAALDLLTAGPRSLATVAAEVGFTDQAHLTRILRAETGQSPARLRALLHASPDQVADAVPTASKPEG